VSVPRCARRLGGLGLAAGVFFSPPAPAGAGPPIDGRTLAWGIETFGPLAESPAAPDSQPSGFQLDAADLYHGTGIRQAGAGLQLARPGFVVAAAAAQLATPVGGATRWSLAAQARCGPLASGAALERRTHRFVGFEAAHDAVLRTGVSVVRGETALVVQAELPLASRTAPRVKLAGAWRLGSGRAALEWDREPGLETRWRLGFACRYGLEWRAGIDCTALAVGAGFGWSGRGFELAWGARSHPVLGWSQAWSLGRWF
jgi:hypothetical protein